MSEERPTPRPRSVRARKKALVRQVRFATQDGRCATLEGPIDYLAGDAIVTGEQGEQWPVRRAYFERSYRPAASIAMGVDGAYARLSETVSATPILEPTAIRAGVAGDRLTGHPGDWIVEYPDGSQGIVRADIFAATYEMVDDRA